MTVEDDTLPEADPAAQPAPVAFDAPERRGFLRRRAHRPHVPHPHVPRPHVPRPRVRKLRLLFVLAAFSFLAVISVLFGLLTSIAADLPQLRNTVQFSHNVDSYMYDANGTPIGALAPASTPAIDNWRDISQNVVHAVVAVEDKGFWGESGISIRGLLRAGLADLTGGATQGASTIPEQFIKNVRQEEAHRSILEKLVEAGMAFQLSHTPGWSHERILTDYLNTIYFGNGALGIEAAARVYFGAVHGFDSSDPGSENRSGCGTPDVQDPHRQECAKVLSAAQAALLAAMIANPSAFNPAGTHQERMAALGRRNNVVLYDMYEQHYLTYEQYMQARAVKLPSRSQIQQPQEQPSAAPYFTSWVEPLVVRALEKEGLTPKEAQYQAYYGGLKIKLSLDENMQTAAQQAVNTEFPPGSNGPTASLVAIDNRTGEVRAMVSGNGDYQHSPFNLATLGYRQPGSSFKLFTLAAAISEGKITPYTEFDSHQLTIPFVKKDGNAFYAPNGTGRFPVHNFGNVYSGWIPMTVATATSDNSVFAQLGTSVGTGHIRHYAKLLGIRSPIDDDPSMILGGLTTGVSALDMAHAYSTVANGGKKVYNPTLGDYERGPIGIASISGCKPCDHSTITNHGTMKTQQVITPDTAAEIDELLHGPVDDSYGTGTNAAIAGVDVAGKTGTTSNYEDAWFVGWTPTLTVAVWVGYPNSGVPMTTAYYGKPVEGGTFPAIIFHNFVVQAIQIMNNEAAGRQTTSTQTTVQPPPVYNPPSVSSASGSVTSTSAGTGTSAGAGTSAGTGTSANTGASAGGAGNQTSATAGANQQSSQQAPAQSNQQATQQPTQQAPAQAPSNAGTNSAGTNNTGASNSAPSTPPPSQSAPPPATSAPPAPSTPPAGSSGGSSGGSGL